MYGTDRITCKARTIHSPALPDHDPEVSFSYVSTSFDDFLFQKAERGRHFINDPEKCVPSSKSRCSAHTPNPYVCSLSDTRVPKHDTPLRLKPSDLATRPDVQRNHLCEDTSCTLPTAQSKEDGTAERSYIPNLQNPPHRELGTCAARPSTRKGTHCPAVERNTGTAGNRAHQGVEARRSTGC